MQSGLTLGPERRRYLEGCPGFYVRIDDDIRKTVLFIGHEDASAPGGIRPIGTGFLTGYDDGAYMVTARHIAWQLGTDPFVVRVNKNDRTSETIHVDGVEWTYHPDPTVDVAVVPAQFGQGNYAALYLPPHMLVTDQSTAWPTGAIGIGDLTYTVGLFRLMSGKNRNLPIVHSGSVAMMPGDERIPMKDWRDPAGQKIIDVEGYLIEANSLDGLSGSPVFVRPTVPISTMPNNMIFDPRYPSHPLAEGLVAAKHLLLLGMWQGAWDAPPDGVMAVQAGKNVRVSVGLGVVVPGQKIMETFEMPDLVAQRARLKAERAERQAEEAASPESVVSLSPPEQAVSDGDVNPHHREDFTRLVNAATRTKPQAD